MSITVWFPNETLQAGIVECMVAARLVVFSHLDSESASAQLNIFQVTLPVDYLRELRTALYETFFSLATWAPYSKLACW